MKDWRTTDDYPDGNDKDMRRWAWEFLRRNSDYQSDFDRMSKLIDQFGNPDDWCEYEETPDFCILMEGTPPVGDGETFSQYLERVKKAKVRTRYGSAVKKFHLSSRLYDPATDWDEIFSMNFWLEGGGITFHHRCCPGTKMRIATPKANVETLVRFDLMRPLDTQLEQAKRMLREQQKRVCGKVICYRKWLNKLQTYLRVLDALNDGAKKSDIVNVIYPNDVNAREYGYPASKKLDKDIASAKRYCDGDYITLID